VTSDTENKLAISVLVPVFNVEGYLHECLDSIRAQSFTNFEVICINDGSTDNSRAILEEYSLSDRRFKIIDKTNTGYGASMNIGLKTASGKYISIVESDDFIDREAFEKLYHTAETYHAQVVKANYFAHWSSPVTSDKLVEAIPKSMQNSLVNPIKTPDVFYIAPTIWSALYLKSFLQEHDIWFLETPGASYQDTSFTFKVWIAAERVFLLSDAFVYYRQDNENSSVYSSEKITAVHDEYKEIERYIHTKPEIQDSLEPIRVRQMFNTYVWNYQRLSEQDQLEYCVRIQQELLAEEAAGRIKWSIFKRRDAYSLKTLLRNPLHFHAECQARYHKTLLGKAKHYLRHGGWSLLLRVFINRVFGV
jgi:glycosyltransferase involved in cell wall biosynthesis